ncbi:MAG: beta-lactamase family protein [Flavobacteriaceae bacterium]|nr:beta-lactamase family protein [Flavobacteriaceae bacterium]
MKILKRILFTILGLVALLVLLAYLFNVDYLFKAVRTIYLKGYKTAYLEDYKVFDNVTVKASENTIPWPIHSDYNKAQPTEKLLKTHKEAGTIAYLIIKNDSIWHESYYDGFDKSSKSNSFSMAKSFVSGLLGKAIMDGYIESLDQPLSDFFSKYEGSKTTVGDLSSMSSGIDWDERYYSPFSITTKAYFYDDLDEMMLELDVVDEPGTEFKYLSGSTQLLAMVIEKATGRNTADYFSESFWKPLGTEYDALWQIDSEKNEMVKSYCCFASNARDFARFGKLYKDHGKWQKQQLLDSAFVAKSIKPRFEGAPYGYGFWLGESQDKNFFAMRGHLGQYVIVFPQENIIVVRLGHSKGETNGIETYPKNFMIYMEEAFEMLN